MVFCSASVALGPRVLFSLSKTERTTHTWEDLWNTPQLSTGSATLFREPQTSSDVYLEHTHKHDY